MYNAKQYLLSSTTIFKLRWRGIEEKHPSLPPTSMGFNDNNMCLSGWSLVNCFNYGTQSLLRQ